MPKDNIERAIAKGTGADSDADAFEAVLYEGYGPGGVAILVEALTDNRNRTGSEVRHAFTKSRRQPGRAGLGGVDLREEGRDRGGRRRATPRTTCSPAIDAGAEDVALDERRLGDRDRPDGARRPCGRRSRTPAWRSSRPSSSSGRPPARPVEEDRVGTLMRLIDALEDHDDVQGVHANFDVDAEVLERVAAA